MTAIRANASVRHAGLQVRPGAWSSMRASPVRATFRRGFSERRCTVIVCASTGLFYSTSTGKTADIAEIMKEKLPDAEGPFEVADVDADFSKYDNVIVGAPTWNTDADTERSGTAWDEMADMGALSGKKVAVFGLGDQSGYGDYFCDAMGELHDKFEKAGAKMCGYVSRDDYTLFEDSKSLKGDMFVGLPLDEDNEDDQSEGRIEAWIEQLKGEGMTL